jgi:hypothetical protein
MPTEDYRRKQLSRLYTNGLFRQIEESGIPVTDFELTQRVVNVRWLSSSLIGLYVDRARDRESWPAAVIEHSRSRSNFQIMQIYEDGFRYRSLTDSRMSIDEELELEWRLRRRISSDWAEVTSSFGKWLTEIEESQKDPDLWEEHKRNRAFLSDQHDQDVENTPFTSDEQAEVSAQIKQVKDYIMATFELTSEQVAHVNERLDQTEQASKHLGRKDWLLLFNGAVFSLILTDLITPQAAEHIIMLTVHGLGHLFGFGGPPPHLLSGS